ncbi:MAG: aminopeptidase P family protein [Bacteroidales bacterium]
MSKQEIVSRIDALRKVMRGSHIDAYVISGTDPHLSEYMPSRWETRKFITGFTGSAGNVIITMERAILWTDSRYFIQAEEELEGTGVELYKLGVDGVPTVCQFLYSTYTKDDKVGYDGFTFSPAFLKSVKKGCSRKGINMVECGDLLSEIWKDRPVIPGKTIFKHDERFATISRAEKLLQVEQKLAESGASAQIMVALDEIAWLLNLRGTDVQCNPVFVGYFLFSSKNKVLFVADGAISDEIRAELEQDGVEVDSYYNIEARLTDVSGETFLIDSARINITLKELILFKNKTVKGDSPATYLKAIKHPSELEHIRNAMKKDAVAMLNFIYWLRGNAGKGITELDAANMIMETRSSQSEYYGPSFFPIIGFNPNGAVVHYRVNEESALKIEKEGFLLCDSGGQYQDGTTDITRTFAMGELTHQQKVDYTMVLKGMINLTLAKFPKGTLGIQLDSYARRALWRHNLDYGHGTGHGVGYFMNVHEGPANIRKDYNSVGVEEGMIFSNEPGIYRDHEYGIRIENIFAAVLDTKNEYGDFLKWETLTLCPIDTAPVLKELLLEQEVEWLNAYHKNINEKISPIVDGEIKQLLDELTIPI